MALKLKSKTDEEAPAAGTSPSAPDRHVRPSAAKPSAMLVPTYIREARALAVTRRQVWYAMIAVVAVLVLAVAGAFLANITSKSSMDEALTAKGSAQEKVNRLGPVADYYDGLEQRSRATVALLSNDVRHADLFDFTNTALPSKTGLMAYTTTFGVPCASSDPFAATDAIGCITITAETDSRAKVAATVAAVNKAVDDPLIQGAFVTTVTSGEEGGVKFTMNMNFTPSALSMKYVPQDTNSPAGQEPATTPTQDGTP